MPIKPVIVFTFPNVMGGVASFNYNIINFTSLKSKFYIKVILIQKLEDIRTPFMDTFVVDEVIHFSYSVKENKYFVEKRLNDLIDQKDGAIVTDNEITICAARRFNNPKIIYHLLHDFFYVKQHLQLENYIDNAVAHSSFFSDAIYASNPAKWMNHSFYLPYGVQKQKIDFSYKKTKNSLVIFQ